MNKKYQVIYADPPWDYKGQGVHSPGKGTKKTHSSALEHYPTMTLKEMVKEFTPKLEEWCDEDCLLYMWTSSPHMNQAMKLADEWGFNYATVAFVWYKHNVNPGFYTMSQCELCLVFKRKGGKIPQPRGIRNAKQLVSEPVREHSRKPEEVRSRIESMHPSQNKLEMFCRQKMQGWDCMGNQTEKFEALRKENKQTNLIDQIEDLDLEQNNS